MTQDYPNTFTEEFIRYCRAHHLPPQLFYDLSELLEKMPRYIRLRPHCPITNTAIPLNDSISDEDVTSSELCRIKAGIAASFGLLPSSVEEVEWLPRPYCFAIPRNVAVSRGAIYKSGAVSAMDAASMAAVVALRPCEGELVWDVCCSPGMKLSLISDAIGVTGVAVGTDISINRLFAARSVIKKHQAKNVCLFAADGSSFSLNKLTDTLDRSVSTGRSGNNGLTAWGTRQLRKFWKRERANGANSNVVVNEPTSSSIIDEYEPAAVFITDGVRHKLEHMRKFTSEYHGFDRVLVDAECSHDGSLAHMFLSDNTKRPFASGDSTLTPKFKGIDNEHRMQQLHLALQGDNVFEECKGDLPLLQRLQLDLLRNGFEQLKPGGTLVYCTCSFTYQQNEFIVRRLVRLVNASNESKQHYKGEAVLCHPFTYTHETVRPEALSPIVRLTSAQVASLQERLNADNDPYGIIAAGETDEERDENNKLFTGVRFWPHNFSTSFQFIAKVWKRPLRPSTYE